MIQNIDRKIQILSNINISGTLTKLANSLFMSQPYISHLIKEMEDEYELKLVNRSTRPISLTHAGEVVLDNLKQVKMVQDTMNNNIINLKRLEQHEITLVFNSLIETEKIVKISKILLSQFHNLEFNFVTNGDSAK